MEPDRDTIFALSSGRLPSAIAIVRLSGPNAGPALRLLANKRPLPRRAVRVSLRAADQNTIDEAIAVWFPGPDSATGEDVVELHIHGGRAVLAALLAELAKLKGLRPAEPGEFTRRAFENGKLDLTEAEGLDDLIHADTDKQRRQALRQMQGLLGKRAEGWRQQIIEASALIEAAIDFSDEGDVPEVLFAPALVKTERLRGEIEGALTMALRSERLRDGLVVAIVGPPNAGKSTLLNRLAQREAAIVSPYSGTTRDPIEVNLDLDGYPVTLIDTAGLRDTDDPVEMEGVRRAVERARSADLVLWLRDASAAIEDSSVSMQEWIPQGSTPLWRVRSKIDLVDSDSTVLEEDRLALSISAETGEGITQLANELAVFADAYFAGGEAALVTRVRQRRLLEETVGALDRALAARGAGEEIIAEELRVAAHHLGRLLGRVDVEDVLGEIFSRFCIGK